MGESPVERGRLTFKRLVGVDRSGPPHAPRFTVRASVKGLGEADGEGSSKHEAETAAATALLAQLG